MNCFKFNPNPLSHSSLPMLICVLREGKVQINMNYCSCFHENILILNETFTVGARETSI